MQKKFVTVAATDETVGAAVDRLRSSLPQDSALIVYFASVKYDPEHLAATIQAAFPRSKTVGCTSSGEFVDGDAHDQSVAAVAIGREVLPEVCVQTVDLAHVEASVRAAFKAFGEHFGEPVSQMKRDDYLGLVLFDGLSGMEEQAMQELGTGNALNFVGGSAGDDLQFKRTCVFANGAALSSHAVVVLARCPVGMHRLMKTQSFTALPATLTATKIEGRKVLEFNNRPAVAAYAEALAGAGVKFDAIEGAFMRYPIGLVVDTAEGQDIYIRSPQRVAEDGTSLYFYCEVTEGITFNLMQGGDIIQDTAEALSSVTKGAEVLGIMNFSCILRSLDLKARQQLGDYAQLFGKAPSVGFATYGEAFLGHINQTSVIVVFTEP